MHYTLLKIYFQHSDGYSGYFKATSFFNWSIPLRRTTKISKPPCPPPTPAVSGGPPGPWSPQPPPASSCGPQPGRPVQHLWSGGWQVKGSGSGFREYSEHGWKDQSESSVHLQPYVLGAVPWGLQLSVSLLPGQGARIPKYRNSEEERNSFIKWQWVLGLLKLGFRPIQYTPILGNCPST